MAVSSKAFFIKVGITLVILLVGAWLVLRGVDLKHWMDVSLEFIRQAGPFWFFVGVALLPAIGFPVSVLLLAAGPVFGPTLGLWPTLGLTVLSLAINQTFTYWLARGWLRPLFEKFMARTPYTVPKVPKDSQVEVTLLLRITPGPPFFVQNYILGLAEIPFKIYILVSVAVVSLNATGFVIFGKSIAEGKGGNIVFGVCLLIAAGLILHLVRKHLAKKKALQHAVATE